MWRGERGEGRLISHQSQIRSSLVDMNGGETYVWGEKSGGRDRLGGSFNVKSDFGKKKVESENCKNILRDF